MQVGSEVREISCVLLAEFQMKIHFNLEVWSKENSTGVASVIGLQTRAETGDFGGSLWTICGQSVDNFRKMRIVYKNPYNHLIYNRLKTQEEFPKFNI